MAEAEPIRSGRRVLVIDDASLVRLYYRQLLEDDGFVVEEALNGLEALEALLVGPFDLLIVDVNMPRMDGLTFLRTLRRLTSAAAAIPALVTSTEAAAQDREAARAAGANFYLVKPLEPEVLTLHARLMCGVPA
ncbi:response regulator [Ancylobacter lacus]|uniref:response regulator n=1 Tax=Ancylobacter lacus TaxID=2579970 RepID=UPI001BCDE78C|nr:response regulator [Ancylobacter lacus]MBS7539157.1 response regulator [Ancylobacter lacus]